MSDEIPPVDPTALEIHQNFCRKMRPGGEIDRILNGGQPIEKAAPETDAEIELRKKQIEVQLGEYKGAIDAAVRWYRAWKANRPKGFRCVRQSSTDNGS